MMFFVVVSVLLGLHDLVGADDVCPSSCTLYGKTKCYFRVDAKKSWNDAKDYCQKCNSYLAVIHSKEENGFLVNALIQPSLTGNFHYWIGLNSNLSQTWTNNETLDYTNWDTSHNTNNSGVDCVMLQAWSNSETIGKWKNERCNETRKSVCVSYEATTKPVCNLCTCGYLQDDDGTILRVFGTNCPACASCMISETNMKIETPISSRATATVVSVAAIIGFTFWLFSNNNLI
jgi:hypothetical protein